MMEIKKRGGGDVKRKAIKINEMARYLQVDPAKLSQHAEEIEATKVYKFGRTPLGSFLFDEDDYEVLKDYLQVAAFFGRKRETMDMFRQISETKYRIKSRPDWMKHMPNAFFR